VGLSAQLKRRARDETPLEETPVEPEGRQATAEAEDANRHARGRGEEAMSEKHYYDVTTWEPDGGGFTPQVGCRRGPWSKWGLRKALRRLQELGYETRRREAFSVLVERRRKR
jgi:hypothetical protein